MIMSLTEFNPEFYQKQLASLTINSRAVITELTTIAEKNVDKCNEICELVEARIKKCLPQHKLNAIYLLDSICKNVGNPYNVIFAKNLFKTFTETYSIVTDTPTRQHLINLFKTWLTGRTNTGSELFPQVILGKIEKFIIQATSISGSTPPPTSAGPNTTAPKFRLAPDWLMKEGRSLLLFIIRLNETTDQISESKERPDEGDLRTLQQSEFQRNTLVSLINETLDGIMFDMRGSDGESTPTLQFESNVKKYHANFETVRKDLDSQVLKIDAMLKRIHDKSNSARLKEEETNKSKSKKIKLEEFIAANKVTLKENPNLIFFTNITEDIRSNEIIFNVIKTWGKQPVANIPKEEPKENEPEPKGGLGINISSSLGMDFGSFSFSESILEGDKNEKVESETDSPEKKEGVQEQSILQMNSVENPTETAMISESPPLEKKIETPLAVPQENEEDNLPDVLKNPSDDEQSKSIEDDDDDYDPYDPPSPPPIRSPPPTAQSQPAKLYNPEVVLEDEDDDEYVPSFDGNDIEDPSSSLPPSTQLQLNGYAPTGTGVIRPKAEGYNFNSADPVLPPIPRPSILKRKAADNNRIVKRVRFDV